MHSLAWHMLYDASRVYFEIGECVQGLSKQISGPRDLVKACCLIGNSGIPAMVGMGYVGVHAPRPIPIPALPVPTNPVGFLTCWGTLPMPALPLHLCQCDSWLPCALPAPVLRGVHNCGSSQMQELWTAQMEIVGDSRSTHTCLPWLWVVGTGRHVDRYRWGAPKPTLQVQVWNRVFKVRTPTHTLYEYGYMTHMGWLDLCQSLIFSARPYRIYSTDHSKLYANIFIEFCAAVVAQLIDWSWIVTEENFHMVPTFLKRTISYFVHLVCMAIFTYLQNTTYRNSKCNQHSTISHLTSWKSRGWRGCHFHNESCNICNSEQILFWTATEWWMHKWLSYFNVTYHERANNNILYHVLLAIMLLAPWKINELKSTSLDPHHIPRFKVSVLYPNNMKVLSQLVYLGSVGSHLSVITPI